MTAFRLFVGRLSHSLSTNSPQPPALHNVNDILNPSTYVYLLQCCIQKKSLQQGKRVHALMLHRNQPRFMEDLFLHNTLLLMYVKCGSFVDARGVFDRMMERDVFSWNVMISAYKKQDLSEEALALFYQMQRNGSGVQPDEFTYASVLPACVSSASLEEGVAIHQKIIKRGFHSDVVVMTALIDMYAKFGIMHKAHELFDKMQQRNTILWNSMIIGYAQIGLLKEAENLFREMQQRNTISWNAMIAGFAQNGIHEKALEVFEEMQISDVPDEFTFATVLTACATSASLQVGVDIHRKIVRSGFQWDVVVTNNLIDMYAKFGNMHKARILFDKTTDRNIFSWNTIISGYAQNGFLDEAVKFFKEIPQRDIISWNAMITGYAQNGHGLEALKCFQKMQLTRLRPDSITFASALAVCGTFAALKWGMDIHGQIIRCGFLSHAIVITALIDMYAKCGSIKKATVLFYKMRYERTILWTAMIAGYARNSCSKEAIKLFEEMKLLGLSPNHVTFISVLSACSHAGLVKEGYQYFKSMSDYYQITPTMEHYTCMADLLGRAGRLDEAKNFIKNMPIKPDAAVWNCLLGACRIHNNLKLAEFVAEQLLELDPQNSVPYVLLSSIYAMSDRWNQIENIRKMMKDRGIRKLPGCSWIVINKQVHIFFVGDESHPKTQEIYGELERLSQVMKAVGYVPDTRFVLQDF